MRKTTSCIAICVLVALFLGGCFVLPPQEKVNEARKQFEKAVAVSNWEQCPDELQKMVDLKERIKREISAQGQRLAIFRSYGPARVMCDTLISLCQDFECVDRHNDDSRLAW